MALGVAAALVFAVVGLCAAPAAWAATCDGDGGGGTLCVDVSSSGGVFNGFTLTADVSDFDFQGNELDTSGIDVTFSRNSVPIGTATTNSNGEATLTAPLSLQVGTFTLHASAGGVTDSLTQTVTPASTIATGPSVGGRPVSGQNLNVLGLACSLPPTVMAPDLGFLTFSEGGSTLASVPVIGGSGQCAQVTLTKRFTAGVHSIDVAYSGGFDWADSPLGDIPPFTVFKDDTTTALTSSANPSAYGQSLTYSATVSANSPGSGTPTGTVDFLDGGSEIGTGTLSGGVATFTTSALGAGSHTITASYEGDSNFNGGTGSLTGTPQVVNKADQSITFAAPTGVTYGDPDFDPGASASSGLPVSYSTSTPDVCTIVAGELHVAGAGSCTVDADQAGDSNYNAASEVERTFTVAQKASPTLGSVSAPGSGTVGSSISGSAVSATLSGGASASGAVHFVVFGPQASAPTDCSSGGTAVGPAFVSGDGTYSPPGDFTPSQAGDYWWYASYDGDSNNNGANSGCGAAMTETVISPASPGVGSVLAPPSGTVGSPIPAFGISASLLGSSRASGTITFTVFGPQPSAPTDCSTGGTTVGPAFVSGDGTYNPPGGFTPSQAGDYWWYASYGGDSNNNAANSGCGSTTMSETVVSPASPLVGSVLAPPSQTVGSAISGSVVSTQLHGSVRASGTITFTVFGPQSTAPTDCSSGGTSVGNAFVSGDGTYSPPGNFTPNQAGDYWWYASYGGDSNNNAANSGCGSSMSETVVNPASPIVGSVLAPPFGTAGTRVTASSISAVLFAGASPTGTITFKVFGPQSSAPSDCSGGTMAGTAAVSGNRTYTSSAGFTPPQPGDYWWYASYSGDPNNNSVASTCGGSMAETVVGIPAPQNTVAPVISGSAQDGQYLRVTSGRFRSLQSLTFGYQWQRCQNDGTGCVNVPAASPAYYYKQTPADVGHLIQVVVTATDQESQTGQATATAVGPVQNPSPPQNTAAPAVTGTPVSGQYLKASRGSWTSPDTLAYSYEWQRCESDGTGCVDVAAANPAYYYKQTPDDVGHLIQVIVTATDQENQSASHTSNTVGPVQNASPPQNTAAPQITGTTQDGQYLKATRGSWTSPETLTYSYQWQRCQSDGTGCVNVPAANPAYYYKQTPDDVGHLIQVTVTATDQENQSASHTSNTVGPVQNPPPPQNTAAPQITGTTQSGQYLRATRGSWTSPDTLTYSYQWQRCQSDGTNCVNVPAAGPAYYYKQTPADIGHLIQVTITATDQENQTTGSTSTAVGPPTS